MKFRYKITACMCINMMQILERNLVFIAAKIASLVCFTDKCFQTGNLQFAISIVATLVDLQKQRI